MELPTNSVAVLGDPRGDVASDAGFERPIEIVEEPVERRASEEVGLAPVIGPADGGRLQPVARQSVSERIGVDRETPRGVALRI